MNNPFHAGELQVQELTGESDFAALNGRMIGNVIPVAARKFLSNQEYCVLGGSDGNGDLWASFIGGLKGFASCDEDGGLLEIKFDDVAGTLRDLPPFPELHEGSRLGFLFIELSTRRRLRVNGSLDALSANNLIMLVDEAYPNCPKYIQRRQNLAATQFAQPGAVQTGKELNAEIVQWISSADTAFVASAAPDGPADVSHRGGNPGFISITGGTLRIPDYPGNSMFGTLGNFAINPRAGLCLTDFANNRQLQLTGDVTLDLTSGKDLAESGGTGRWWEFTPRKWAISPLNRQFDWSSADLSPFNP